MSVAMAEAPGAVARGLERAIAPTAGSPWFSWALVAIGIALRAGRYLQNNSLEVAESQLTLNLIARSYAELARPLDHDQGAPIGFLWIVRFLIERLGSAEWVLRLFPFVAAVASVFLFRALAERLLERRAARIALALFACAPPLLWYSSQVKQYSSDVAIAAALLLAAWEADRRGLSPGSLAAWALAGAVAIPLSHPAVFTLGGTGLALASVRAARREWSALARLAAVGAVWLALFSALWVGSLRGLASNRYLLEYWAESLMPLPPRSYEDLSWFVDNFFGAFRNPGGFEIAGGLAALCFLVGAVSLWREDHRAVLLLVGPGALTLLASGLRQYPFGQRLILFLSVPLLLLVAHGAERFWRWTRAAAPFAGRLLVALLLLEPVMSAAHSLASPKRYEDLRPLVEYLESRWQPGDRVYLYADTQYAFGYYAARRDLDIDSIVVGRSSESRWDEDLDDLAELEGSGRVWLLFSHIHREQDVTSEERFFLVHLDRMGRRLDTRRSAGASIHLYELPR